MAKIMAPRVEGSDGEFTARQVVKLKGGLYGGMFAWYSLPKLYQKYQSTDMEERFFVGFVVTHDRAYRELTNYSEAMMGVKTKRFYDATTGMKSAYVSLLYALFGGKKSYEEIEGMSDDELPDFNDLIGRPATLFIEPNQKADKNGLFGHKIKGLEPADKEFTAAIKPLYKLKTTETNDKDVTRLTLPCAAYEDDVLPSTNGSLPTEDDLDDLDDEIPF